MDLPANRPGPGWKQSTPGIVRPTYLEGLTLSDVLFRSTGMSLSPHSVEDASLNPLFTEKHIAITPGSDWLVSPVTGMISVALFMAVGVALHRRRARTGSADAVRLL